MFYNSQENLDRIIEVVLALPGIETNSKIISVILSKQYCINIWIRDEQTE